MHTSIFPQKNAVCVVHRSHTVTGTEAAVFALPTHRYVISDYAVNSLCLLKVSVSDFHCLHTQEVHIHNRQFQMQRSSVHFAVNSVALPVLLL